MSQVASAFGLHFRCQQLRAGAVVDTTTPIRKVVPTVTFTLPGTDVEALLFDEETFDCVVSTLSLCCIPDHRQAAREMWRVLRPGCSLLLLDHVRSHTRLGLMIQHALERTRQGEYYTRRSLDYLAEVGFEISGVRSTRRGWVECVSARKPVTS